MAAKVMIVSLLVGLLLWIGFVVGLAGTTRESVRYNHEHEIDIKKYREWQKVSAAISFVPQYLLVVLYIPVVICGLLDIRAHRRGEHNMISIVFVTLSYILNIAFLLTYGASFVEVVSAVAVQSIFYGEYDSEGRRSFAYDIVQLVSLVGLLGFYLVYLCLLPRYKKEMASEMG